MWPSDLFETYIVVLELGRINVQVVMGFPQSKNILLFDIHIVHELQYVIVILLFIFFGFLDEIFLI